MEFSVKVIYIACVLLATTVAIASPKDLPAEAWMSTAEFIVSAGYPVEEHTVRTSDDYLLKIFRIPGNSAGKKFNSLLPPVVLVHGLLTSSRDFVLMGPKKSLGYLLADVGYDVWLPNMRFTRCASHVTISKSNPVYWDFSFDEHGTIDMPEIMDYILEKTKADKIHFIGYSMGSTVYVIMCDVRPDLAKRIASFVGLAPAIYLNNMKPLTQALQHFGVFNMLMSRGMNVVSLNKQLQQSLAELCSRARKKSEAICLKIVYFFIGEDYDQVDWDKAPSIFNRFQAVTIKQLAHFAQLVNTGVLSKYDYGEKINLQKYGSAEPPVYNMTANLAPVILYYGENDKMTTFKDVNKFGNVFRSKKMLMSLRKAKSKMFNHLDFVYAKDVNKLVNKDVIKLLNFISYRYIRNQLGNIRK